MKICIAQTRPKRGDISANLEAHKRFIDLALSLKAEAIFFPELSLTGYEPKLAKKLETHPHDPLLTIFQQISDTNKITIGLGLPTESKTKPRISMIIFEPNKAVLTYSKQQLHSDENPYFEHGVEQVIIKTHKKNIAPAICYESLQESHVAHACNLGADVYVASVAKSEKSIKTAFQYFPSVAKQYAMPVFMCNCVGFCDTFLAVGKSSIWTKEGELLGQLDDTQEGILMYDTETNELISRIVSFTKVNMKC